MPLMSAALTPASLNFFLVKRDALGHPINGFPEFFHLKLLELFYRHTFELFIPGHRFPPSRWSVFFPAG
jgi:hypothetical protein